MSQNPLLHQMYKVFESVLDKRIESQEVFTPNCLKNFALPKFVLLFLAKVVFDEMKKGNS